MRSGSQVPLRSDPRWDGWLECVPNVSEGRDASVLDALAQSITSVPGVFLLHRDANADAHRTVFTFVGPAESVVEAAFRLYVCASERIDLSQHSGAHPRQGAVDVCPLVPLGATPWETAQAAAKQISERIARELNLGGWWYERSASRPERRLLADLRRGGYEALKEKQFMEAAQPDFGSFDRWPAQGMTVIGARPFLIAYNFTLSNNINLFDSKYIASKIRATSGGLPGVRALGWWMEGYGRAQVSCNVTDTWAVSALKLFDSVSQQAQMLGGAVEASELIGLIPVHGLAGIEPVEAAVSTLRLDGHGPFDLNDRILERCMNRLPQ